MFEEQVEASPCAIALVFKGRGLSYQKLNNEANKLARHLHKLCQKKTGKGVEPGGFIALCLDRSFDMIISILAVLKAGAAYVPIDPKSPLERIQYILEDTQSQLVLSQSHIGHCFDNVVYVDKYQYMNESSENLMLNGVAKDLIYVIYTSGSTGLPKGVLIQNKSVVNYCYALKPYMDSVSVVDFSSNLAFDLSVTVTLAPLVLGKTVAIYHDSLVNMDEYIKHIKNVDFISSTPSYLTSISKANDAWFVEVCFVGGEKLELSHYESISKHAQLMYDEYGPTEITVAGLIALKGRDSGIGKPYSNYKVYVLDKHLQPLPIGVIGELYVGGAGLALGYLNQPELTEKSFIPNPFATKEDKRNGYTRLYKTGDLVRWTSGGCIDYVSRDDFQVKIRGLRVELGEIEHALSRIKAIDQSCVVAKKDPVGNAFLVAYYVSDIEMSKGHLIQALKSSLPQHMVPNFYVHIDALPLTSNGKVDKTALPDPSLQVDEEAYIAPRNQQEEKVAAVWCEFLGLEKVGINDNFFNLGGNSLLSIHLTARMRALGFVECGVKDLFDYPTISLWVDFVTNKESDPDKKKVQHIFGDHIDYEVYVHIHKENKEAPPLYFFPSAYGRSLDYLNSLVPHLKSENLLLFNNFIYYLKTVHGNSFVDKYTMESLALIHVQAIKQLQSEGPYTLFGWSFGAVLAFEVARQLEEQGGHIEHLVLLDPHFNAKKQDNDAGDLGPIARIQNNYNIGEVWKTNSRITLFKAGRLMQSVRNEELAEIIKQCSAEQIEREKKMDEYYVTQLEDNNLSSFVASSHVDIIRLESDHFGWLNCPEDIAAIVKSLSRGPA